MRRVSFSLISIAFQVQAVQAETYLHNGSIVDIRTEGAVITIEYIQPSKTMIALGVEKGSLAFEGAISRRTDEVSGNAYKYAGRCGRFPYQVSGRYRSTSLSALDLKGSAPVINQRNCRVTGYVLIKLEYDLPE